MTLSLFWQTSQYRMKKQKKKPTQKKKKQYIVFQKHNLKNYYVQLTWYYTAITHALGRPRQENCWACNFQALLPSMILSQKNVVYEIILIHMKEGRGICNKKWVMKMQKPATFESNWKYKKGLKGRFPSS